MKLNHLYATAISLANGRTSEYTSFTITAIGDMLIKLFSNSGIKSILDILPNIHFVAFDENETTDIPERDEITAHDIFDIDAIMHEKGLLHKAMSSTPVALAGSGKFDVISKIRISAGKLFKPKTIAEFNQKLNQRYQDFRVANSRILHSTVDCIEYLKEIEASLSRLENKEEQGFSRNALQDFIFLYESVADYNSKFLDSSFSKNLVTPEKLMGLRKINDLKASVLSTLNTAIKSTEGYDSIFIQNSYESLCTAVETLIVAAETLRGATQPVLEMDQDAYSLWLFNCLVLHKLAFSAKVQGGEEFQFAGNVTQAYLIEKLILFKSQLFNSSKDYVQEEHKSKAVVDPIEDARKKFIDALQTGKPLSAEDFKKMQFIHELSVFDFATSMLTSGMTKCLEDRETGLLMMREAVRNASLNSTETVTTALDEAQEFMLTKLKENLEKK